VEDILVFYHLSFKDVFVFSDRLWRCRTKVLGWRKNSSDSTEPFEVIQAYMKLKLF